MNPIKHIPNTLTSCNLLCGCLAVRASFEGDPRTAFLLMIAAAVFDFADGLSARLLKAYSPIGKELDSLADMVSFGLVPAFLAFNAIRLYQAGLAQAALPQPVYIVSLFCTLLIAVFSALRLAKFNIDERQSENFIGLATPSCALLIGSLLYAARVYPGFEQFLADRYYLLALLCLILAGLLVSEIPMFSFKFKSFGWKDNAVRFLFLALAALSGIAVLASGLHWSLWISATFAMYIVLNSVYAVLVRFFRNRI